MEPDQKNLKNILLVEDDPLTASLQTVTLQKFGYNVILALTGEKAVDIALKKNDIDIILMDIDLGDGIDGTEVAEKILKKKDVPVLFLSNHTEPEIVESTEKITSYGYVIKNSGGMVLNASIKMAFKLHEAQKREKEKEAILKQNAEELSALYEISKNINFTLSEKKTVSCTLKSIMKAVNPSIAFIFFRDNDKLILQEMKNDKKQNKIDNMPEHKVGQCLCGLAVKERKTIFSFDITTDKRCIMEECKKAGFKSFAALPLLSHDNIIGVMGLASKYPRDFESQKQFLESLASEISISLINTRLFNTLQKELMERKLNEKIFRESEEKHKILFEGSAQGILVADVETKKFLFANPAICKMLGYTEKELLKMSVSDIHPKESLDKIFSEFDAQFKREKYLAEALPCLRKNKTVFYADIATAPAIINGIKCNVGFFLDITERLKAEQSLIESEQRYKMVSDLSSDYFFKIAVQHENNLILEYVSESFEKTTGRTIKETRTIDQWKNIFYPEDISNIMQFIKKLLTGQPGIMECRSYVKGNKLRWIEIIAQPEWDETHKKITALLGAVKDISDRKVAELEVIEAKNFAENLIQTANIIFVELDINGNVVRLNKTAEEITGYKAEDVIGKSWFETLVPKDRYPFVWKEFTRIIKSGEIPSIFENPILTKTGEEKYIVWKNNLFIKDNKIYGTISFGIDITTRKLMEEELKKSEARYRMIVDNINDAFYIHDFKGKILDLNDNACKMLGYTKEELLKMGIPDIDTPENLKKLPARMTQLIKDGFILFEDVHIKKDKSKVFVNISAKIISYEGKGLIQSIVRDITENKKTENDLAHALEEKNSLLRELQHRIKNTLTLITSLAGLEADSTVNPLAQDALKNIQGKIETLSNLYSLLYSTGEVKEVRLDKYLKSIVNSIFFAYRKSNKKIEPVLNLAEISINIKHASSIGLILNELITNSFKYAFTNKVKGIIKIVLTKKNKNFLNLLISDNGTGFPEGLYNIKTKGFGLKLVKILTEQLKADLSYSQNNWNKFKFKIPLQ